MFYLFNSHLKTKILQIILMLNLCCEHLLHCTVYMRLSQTQPRVGNKAELFPIVLKIRRKASIH